MMKTKINPKEILAQYGIYVVFAVIFIALSFSSRTFLTTGNMINILRQTAIVSIIAIGQTYCLISGGLDLSSGSVMAFAGVCSAMFGRADDTNMFLAITVALGVGAMCGFVNGIVIAKGKVPAFIATLGMQLAARGLALLVTNATPVFNLSDEYIFLGGGRVFGIPMIIIVMIVVLGIASVILNRTKFGRHIYAVGGNEISAHVSGIKVDTVKLQVYVVNGILTGLAGFLLAGRLQSGTPTMAEGYELDAIAGAVIGGVSTSGGVGRIYGAIIGSILLSMIGNGLDLLNVSAYYQMIINGAIVVSAVLFDVKTKKS